MARNYEKPEPLIRYDLRRANKYLVEKLDGKPERNGKIFAIKLDPNTKDVNLWVPNGIEVYSSVRITDEERAIKRIVFTHRKEENDLLSVYASLISEQGENPSLFDFCWYNPNTSRRIYDVINNASINFDKLYQELTAPTVKNPGFNHPLKDV